MDGVIDSTPMHINDLPLPIPIPIHQRGLISNIVDIIASDQKSDLHGTSFQSSPKINRMLITRAICIQ